MIDMWEFEILYHNACLHGRECNLGGRCLCPEKPSENPMRNGCINSRQTDKSFLVLF
jgi:hypothetical protein